VKWPFVTRRIHAEKLASVTAERDYWKDKAEELMDAALIRAGAIHQPTMARRPGPTNLDAASMITAAMAITEIDSSTFKKKAQAS